FGESDGSGGELDGGGCESMWSIVMISPWVHFVVLELVEELLEEEMLIIDFLNASYVKYTLTINPTVYTSWIEQFWASAKVKNVNGEAQLQTLVDKKKVIITEASIRRDLRHNAIFVISSHTKKVFANMKREGKDFYENITPLFETMMVQAPEDMGEGSEIRIDTHHTPMVTQPSFSLPHKKQKSRRKQRKEIEVPSPSSEIPNKEELKRLRKIRTASRIESLTEASLGDQEDASKQERMIDNIDQDVEITLVDNTQGRMNEEDMFGVNDLDGDEVVVDISASEKVEQSVKVVEKEDELTLAQTLIEIKAAKPKAITTAATTVTAVGTRRKGIMVEPEKPLKKKAQIIVDEEVAKNLEAQMQAELKEKERLARLKEEETNIALVAEWDNKQAMMDADCKLAVRLQEEEREELTIEEKSSDKAVEGSEKAKEGSSKRAGSNLE
nr:hypothetical protein [Tanacetum cinerariifolium]